MTELRGLPVLGRLVRGHALALLEGRYAEGETVRVDVAGDELVLK